MGKKDKKPKKVSAKKERYSKFHTDRFVSNDLTMPDLTEDEMRRKREDELKIGKHLRFNKNPNPKSVVERRDKSKR